MPKGRKNPVPRSIQKSAHTYPLSAYDQRTRTHETPVSEEEELGQRVKWNVRARALRVVVRAAELSTSGREATTGNEGGGHSGPESDGRVHLHIGSDRIHIQLAGSREHTLYT